MSESNLPAKPRTVARWKRNGRVKYAIRRLRATASHLDDPRYLPLMRDFCVLGLFIERGVAELGEKPLLSPVTGELRQSLNTLRQLIDSHRTMARELGLSPTVAASFAKPAILDLEALRGDFNESE